MMRLEVREIGDALCIVLPPELIERHNIKKGDYLYAEETPEGFLFLVNEPEFEKQMRLAHKVMDVHREALRELADK